MTQDDKQAIIKEYALKDGDVGSAEVQIAILTRRITELSGHLQMHKKDHSSRRGLIALVSRRRRLLGYLKDKAHERYLNLIKRLGLRR